MTIIAGGRLRERRVAKCRTSVIHDAGEPLSGREHRRNAVVGSQIGGDGRTGNAVRARQLGRRRRRCRVRAIAQHQVVPRGGQSQSNGSADATRAARDQGDRHATHPKPSDSATTPAPQYSIAVTERSLPVCRRPSGARDGAAAGLTAERAAVEARDSAWPAIRGSARRWRRWSAGGVSGRRR